MRASRLWLIPLVAAAGCGREESVAPTPALPALERPYRAPLDGRLTEAQVQSYVGALRAGAARRAARTSEASAAGNATRPDEDPGPADRGSGREELLWIRQKVLEAEMRLDGRAAARREVEIDRKAIAALRDASAASTDPATRESLARQIADLERRAGEREKEGRKPGDPSETANDALVSRYRRAIGEAELPAPSRR